MNFVNFGSHLWQTGASKNKILKLRIRIWQINLHFSKKGLKKKISLVKNQGLETQQNEDVKKMSAFVCKLIDYGLNFQQLHSKSTNLRGKING